jgi:hypothetical protein
VWLVGASRGAVDDLARSIAAQAGASIGLHRFSLTQLAVRLAAPVLAEQGLAPVTYLGTEAVAARATFEAQRDAALAYFAPVARTPGFPRALARTLQEIRLAQVDPDRLGALPLGGPDLAALLERFDEQFASASATDRTTLFIAATRALHLDAADRGAREALLLLDVPIDSLVELDFIKALIGHPHDASTPERCPATLVTLPRGDDATADKWRALGLQPEELPQEGDSDLAALRRFLFEGGQPPEREPAGDVRFFSAPGEGREAVEIARRIVQEARGGVPFDEIAVFVRAPQRYVGLLEHALRRAGVPAWFDRGTRRPHPAGRAFLAILACACEHLSARRFAEYLSLAQVPRLEETLRVPEFVPPSDEELGSWRMEAGGWRLAAGGWRREDGGWTLGETTEFEDDLSTSNLQPPTSELQPPNSNLQPPTSNLQPPLL